MQKFLTYDNNTWSMDIFGYLDYIKTIENKLPKNAYSFINEPWHYDSYFHQCPHNAKIERLEINEVYPQDNIFQRETNIFLILLNSYCDSILTIKYNQVIGYEQTLHTLPYSNINNGAKSNHDNLLYDELIINDNDFIEHTIALGMGKIFIECKDIDYKSFLINDDELNTLKNNLQKFYI